MPCAPYETAIASVGNAFSKLFGFLKSKKEKQLESEFIEDSERQHKAIRAANMALDTIAPFLYRLPEKTRKKFQKYKKIFDDNIA